MLLLGGTCEGRVRSRHTRSRRAGIAASKSVLPSELQYALCLFGGDRIDLESSCLSIYSLYAGHSFLLKKADTQ